MAETECPRCGAPMQRGTAFLCGPDGGAELSLPPTCPDVECRRAGREERDKAALARAIEQGIIDP